MSFLPSPRHFADLAEFETYVGTLSWDKGWHPAFLTGHNTGIPRLSQYLAYSEDVRHAWPGNLNRYYHGLGWHAGPHFALCPLVPGGGIWQLCDLEADGVSVSCWNGKTIGIECVGDYETEDPTTGHGAEVRDLFVGVASILHRRLGWRPQPQVLGISGVHWHHQCVKDHHPCPGKRWDGNDVIARIEAAMGRAAAAQPAPPAAAPVHDTRWLQMTLNDLGATPPLVVDGDSGPATKAAIKAFQGANGLATDGLFGPLTLDALQAALQAPQAPQTKAA